MAISLLPLLWELEQPIFMQQQFAHGLSPKEFCTMTSTPRPRDYARPWDQYFAWKAENERKNMESETEIKKELENFEIHLELRHFAPEEISVKVIDGFVKVEAFHQERRDGYRLETRQFVRRYALPDGCNENAVKSHVSADGVLTVSAPIDGSERDVPRFLQRRDEFEELYEVGDEKFDKKKLQEEEGGKKNPEEKDLDEKESQKKQGVKEKPEDKDPEDKEPQEKDPENKEPTEKDVNEKNTDENKPEEKKDVEDGQ